MMMSGRNSRYPFTPSQWQELEHQALIYKYMASGHPIPSDLILNIRRSFLLDSITTPNTTPTLCFPPQQTLGWSCLQMGFGRKAEDPEPGRCRRTDGKKWRCSKEAYPDSKYCERHMHRGKNRSRKPVEMSLNNTNTSSTTQPPPLSLSSQPESYHLLYPYPSCKHPANHGFNPYQQNTTTHLHLDPPSYSQADKDYRYCQEVKDVDEYTFFSQGSRGNDRGSSWEFRPLGMSSLGEPKEVGQHALQQQQSNYNSFSSSKELVEERQQHCFILGADFKLQKPTTTVKEEKDDEEEAQKPLRHFFDEWPQKNRAGDSWMDLEGHSNQTKTQLSISTPMTHHDFLLSASRYRNDD